MCRIVLHNQAAGKNVVRIGLAIPTVRWDDKWILQSDKPTGEGGKESTIA
jgi:hypothetical protein